MIHSVARLRKLQEILRHTRRDLMLLRPLPHVLKIAANMYRIEVHVRLGKFGARRVEPDLAHDPNIDRAHQLLADDVQAVCWKTLVSKTLHGQVLWNA
jgi:hypothetical protein